MATHSSTLAWKIPWTEEPGRLRSMGSQRVGHDWVTSLTHSTLGMGFPGGASGKEPSCQCRRHKRCGFDPWVGKVPRRRAWQPTPVFLPGESPWTEEPGRLGPLGCKELNTSEATGHIGTHATCGKLEASTYVYFILLLILQTPFTSRVT